MTGSSSTGAYMWTPQTPLCHCLSSIRSSELKHECLLDSLNRAEDAHGWARHMEELSRRGTTMDPYTGFVCYDQLLNVPVFSGEASSAGSFRLWVQTHWLCCCIQQWTGGGRGSGHQGRSWEGEKLWFSLNWTFHFDSLLLILETVVDITILSRDPPTRLFWCFQLYTTAFISRCSLFSWHVTADVYTLLNSEHCEYLTVYTLFADEDCVLCWKAQEQVGT